MVWHKGQAYGQDLLVRVLNAKGSIREVAARFGVSSRMLPGHVRGDVATARIRPECKATMCRSDSVAYNKSWPIR